MPVHNFAAARGLDSGSLPGMTFMEDLPPSLKFFFRRRSSSYGGQAVNSVPSAVAEGYGGQAVRDRI